MVDLHRQLRLLANRQCLFDPFEQPIRLGANVGDIDAIVLTHHLANLDQLGGARIGTRRIDQGAGDPHRARCHCLGHGAAHQVELIRGWFAHLHPHRILTQGTTAQKGTDIGGDTPFGQRFQPIAKAHPTVHSFRPFGDKLRENMTLQRTQVDLVVDRAGG